MLTIATHPLLDAGAFTTLYPAPLAQLSVPEAIRDPMALGPGVAVGGMPATDDACRKAVRDLLRHAGYKPTGRGKPASEYLLAARAAGPLASINLAVDACNAVSLHSGLPISVIDLDLARAPLHIAVAGAGASYAFNASRQMIDLEGLLCLFDADGPCANAVKDAQRTKTHAGTRRTLSIVWGTRALVDRTARTVAWYRELLAAAGAETHSAL